MVSSSPQSRSDGTIDITHHEDAELIASNRPSRRLQIRHETYRWSSPADCELELDPHFYIEFDVYTDVDGMRRFVPRADVEGFITYAFAAGMALLIRDRNLSAEYRSAYRAMKIVFDKVRGMKEHLDRKFSHSRDLYIRRTARIIDQDRSVLSELTGRSQPDATTFWSCKRLAEEGLQRAVEAGVEVHSSEVKIAYGLLAAAEQFPLIVRNSETESLLRAALFAPVGDGSPLTEDCVEEVYGRLIDRLNSHLHDSTEDFQNWLSGPKSNLPRSLAGSTMEISTVRKAMLQMGWKAYAYVVGCVNSFVKAFMRSLPTPMSPEERELFSHMYQPQSYLGGLSLLFLMERQQLIAPVIGKLWTNPGDRETIGVLHRLLTFYTEMALNRREADLRSNARRGRLEIAATDFASSLATTSSQPSDTDNANQILFLAAQRRALRCERCHELPDTLNIAGPLSQQLETQAIPIEFCCSRHGYICQIEFPIEELRSIANELDIDEPD